MPESDSAGAASALTEAIPVPHRAERTTESSAREFAALNEAELVALAKAGDTGAFRAIIQHCNQRLYRIARSVLKDDTEAEDAVQEAYTSAFRHIDSFRGDARLLTWLSRITLNEARGRLRRRRNMVELAAIEHSEPLPSDAGWRAASPEAETARGEARCLIERAIDDLPEPFRAVFILRDVEECSVEETAAALGLHCATVNTRLFRARRMLRSVLDHDLSPMLSGQFPFLGEKCRQMTDRVLARIAPAEFSSARREV
jgi:RNA polymerase sigma-70 factor, ECF subfamily